jgi:predicted ArsR family transcriptional regulator
MNHSSETLVADAGVGDQKKKLLLLLKSRGELGLDDLAKSIGVSKMAVHKHLAALEEKGLVQHSDLRKGVGRPRSIYRLTEEGMTVFPRSYGAIATCALQFIEKNLGREAVEKALRERQNEIVEKYRTPLGKLEFEQRVKALAKIRDKEGYMAETKTLPSGKFVLFEHNCPLIQVAQKYWEACTTEREMFEKLLNAKVETTHRIAGGDMACRFLIQRKKL